MYADDFLELLVSRNCTIYNFVEFIRHSSTVESAIEEVGLFIFGSTVTML